MITSKLIVHLLLILSAAWFLGFLFARFGLPVMLGELLAGVLLGPPLLGVVAASEPIEFMAEWGIFFLMFYTGMELNPRELLEHMWPSVAVAVGGFILPFALGFATAKLFGATLMQSLFLGLGISVSAIAVQSVILHSMSIKQTRVGHVIIGAAIVVDILSLVVLSVLLDLARSGNIKLMPVALVLGKVVAFFAATILLGHFVIPRFTRKLHDREGKAFTFAITTMLIMGYFAEMAGLHLIIGAFLAGQFVRKEIMDEEIYHRIADRFFGLSYGFLVPIFFASLSFHLHVEWSGPFALFALAIIGVAVVGKFLGCGAGAALFKYNFWESTIIGAGMNGRGAVDLVIATVALNLSNELLAKGVITLPLLTKDQFAALVLMAFITTLMAPLTLKWAVERTCLPDEKASFCALWDRPKTAKKWFGR